MKARYLVLLLLPLMFTGACATNPVTGKQDIVFMSEKDEIELGKKVNQQILQQYRVYGDVELQNYVQYVGRKVAEKSHRTELEYNFTVLDSEEVNAFALPGGYIYITRGLMAYLNNEAQLAAVLGHEVGHVTARHAVRQHSATQLASLGAAIGTAFVPGLNQYGGQQLVGALGTAMLRGYGRDHELEADQLGAEYLARSGYDPEAMLDVIRVLKSQELLELRMARDEGRQPQIYHGLFSTHPDNDTRLKEVISAAEEFKASGATYTGRTQYLEQVDGMEFGEGTSHGLVRGRDFYHGHLGFAMRFPPGWAIHNQTQRLVAAAPQNNAMLQVTLAPADPRISPKEFMEQKMGLKQLGASQSLEVHGLPAHTATAVVNSDQGQQMARIAVIYFGASAYIMAGLTRDARALGRYDGLFLDTVRSFRPLSKTEREVASKGKHIKILPADKKHTFESLAQASGLEKYGVQQIRLINGAYPRGNLPAGDLIKTVE